MKDSVKIAIATVVVLGAAFYLASPFIMPAAITPALPDQQDQQDQQDQGKAPQSRPKSQAPKPQPTPESGPVTDPNSVKIGDEKDRKALPAQDIVLPEGTVVTSNQHASTVMNDSLQAQGADKNSKVIVSQNQPDDYGNVIYNGQQQYKGIPIMGGIVTLTARRGNGRTIIGQWSLDTIDLDTTPTYGAKEAFRVALTKQGVPATRPFAIHTRHKPSLAVLVMQHKAHLVWLFEGGLLAPHSEDFRYAVDAHTPEILLQEKVRLH